MLIKLKTRDDKVFQFQTFEQFYLYCKDRLSAVHKTCSIHLYKNGKDWLMYRMPEDEDRYGITCLYLGRLDEDDYNNLRTALFYNQDKSNIFKFCLSSEEV